MTAPCAEAPGLFFSDARDNIVAAKAICATCPTRLACLQDALDRREEFGIYGGTTPDERKHMSAPRVCVHCSALLVGRQRKFCSKACEFASRKPATTNDGRTCALPECDAPLTRSGRQRYCTETHANRDYKRRRAA